MAYATIALIANDGSFAMRLTAAAAEEHKAEPFETWVAAHRWQLAATPGWDEAWESAVAAGVEDPGNDPAVISDAMILAAVQPMP